MKIIIPQALIDQGYITVQNHDECDYKIYNYTNKTMYEGKWNEYTRLCRGLILNSESVVIARPFEKFFNLEEYGLNGKDLPFNIIQNEKMEVFEKMDGSLGILYKLPNGEPRIATRGSFNSEQALKATEIFNKKYKDFDFDDDYTFLFEIIYPENRIVVDYKNMEDLVLLGAIHKETGEEAPFFILQSYSILMGVPLVDVYNFKDIDEIIKFMEKHPDQNKEGFVIKYSPSGLRIKVKYQEYKRLHKLLTGVNEKAIWEILRSGQNIDQFLNQVPDEFYKWITEKTEVFHERYLNIENDCADFCKQCKYKNIDIKTFAELVKKNCDLFSGVLFAMYKDKPYKDIIWKMLKPKNARAFKCHEA